QKTPADSAIGKSYKLDTLFITRGIFGFPNYVATIKTKFILPATLSEDSSFYFEKNYLVLHNKSRNTNDSVALELSEYAPYELKMEDLSDSLKMPPLMLHISWTGDDDATQDEFAGYDRHGLKDMFSIPGIISLQRKDQWTLTGFTTGRDD